jgi:hypothetical protein
MIYYRYGHVFLFVWSIVATAAGLFGLLFPKLFVELNIWGFEKMYEQTGFPIFRMQAEQTRQNDDTLELLRIIGGVVFTIAGVLTFLSLLGIQVNF